MHRRQSEQLDSLVSIWLNSVRATHHFPTEADIQSLLPVVRNSVLPSLDEICLLRDDELIVGFMALCGANLKSLFIEPRYFRRGGGRLLIELARQLKGSLLVSVNEQNPQALTFYLACGFEVSGRWETDDDGRRFPLPLMRDGTARKQVDAIVEPATCDDRLATWPKENRDPKTIAL
jgi:putative acetyltransferase